MSTQEQLAPNYSKLDFALRSIGYNFEAAVADIIDNSIDAKASNVLIRLFASRAGTLDLAIWDNGHGMSDGTLREAMRFGADVSNEIERLGKFGLGLKLASLSQAKELRVVTIQNREAAGRGWLEQGIASGFMSTVFETNECKRMLAQVVPDKMRSESGTLVWWSHLYRGTQYKGTVEERAQKLVRRLENYLALAFHKFLSNRASKLSITIDIFDEATGRSGLPARVDPLDPFGYTQSGHPGFPAALNLDGDFAGKLSLKGHIWPPNSNAPEYKLPGGSNAKQGFYFYRNNRLIQAGGWNGIREVEPHSSLARVEVHVQPTLDLELSLDVKKVEIQLPAEISDAIQRAKTSAGVDFKRYLSLANEAYRKKSLADHELPLVPSMGLPAELCRFLLKDSGLKASDRYRELRIRWSDLDDETFVDIDTDRGELFINRGFRKALLHGLQGSAADVPVVKCLLFLLLEDALTSGRMGSKLREKIERLNRVMIEAVKHERWD